MINITESEKCVQIDNDGHIFCIPRGSAIPRYTNSEFAILNAPKKNASGSAPLVKINRLGILGTVTSKTGEVLTFTDVKDVARQTAKFFI